jgi:hypothetical protein
MTEDAVLDFDSALGQVSDIPTNPANLCPIWCGGTVSLSRAGTTHSAQ